jgi:RimJ/RimL family protein N-acetyltransferase
MAAFPERVELDHPDGIVVRRARVADAPAFSETVSANLDHLVRFLPWATVEAASVDSQTRRLIAAQGQWQAGTERQFVIVRPPRERTILGAMGLMTRLEPGSLEIGYWVGAPYQGRGYVRAAADALTRVGLGVASKMLICCRPDNVRSAAIPLSIGYRDDGFLDAHPADGERVRIFSRRSGD